MDGEIKTGKRAIERKRKREGEREVRQPIRFSVFVKLDKKHHTEDTSIDCINYY